MDINSIKQLMTISRDSFVSTKEEDDVISSIILNEYEMQPQICSKEDCVLENILPLPCELHYFESTQLLHSLLPHEIDSPPIAQISMAKKVVKIAIAPGRELNLRKSLSQAQHKDIVQLLQKHQDAFAWDYIDMKGFEPSLYTHRIYISLDYKPVR